MNKGLVYTSFALIAAALIVSLALLPDKTPEDRDQSEAFRIGQASFFLDSVLNDMERSLSLGSRRMLTSVSNYIITENQALVAPSKNMSSALINGSISGNEIKNLENVSIKSWEDKVENISDDSGYSLNLSVENYSFKSNGINLEASYSVFARLEDPVTLASFNKTNTANTTVSSNDLEDTMLLLRSSGRYISKYKKCGFSDPVEKLAQANKFSGIAQQGKIAYKPSDLSIIASPSEYLLVVNDVDSYSTGEVNNFRAVVSENENSSGGYTNTYAFDTGSIDVIEQNQTGVVKQGGLWREDFSTMFKEKCYIQDDDGPNLIDRLENEMVNDHGSGIATLINVAELPSQLRKEDSSVGFVYFNETGSYGDIKEISGITDEYNWFRLDQHHIDEWNANDLVK